MRPTTLSTPESEKTSGAERALGAREQILPDAVYTTNEAATLVRVQPSTIRSAVRTGTIRGKGRPFRIRGIELFKLL